MQRPSEDGSALSHLLLTSGRIVLWWCIAEYMIHVMYMHAIQANETYLEILPPWALGTSQFYVYLICKNMFYLDTELKNIQPPQDLVLKLNAPLSLILYLVALDLWCDLTHSLTLVPPCTLFTWQLFRCRAEVSLIYSLICLLAIVPSAPCLLFVDV